MFSDYFSDYEQSINTNEISRHIVYKDAVTILQRKCELFSRNNERLVQRLYYVKKITKRKEKDVTLLKKRLDNYNDEWRTAQPEVPLNYPLPDESIKANKKSKKIKRNKIDLNSTQDGTQNEMSKNQINENLTNTVKTEKMKKPQKRNRPKTEKDKDPNAPKRPANPFFQFCQEQRSILLEELNNELQPGEPEFSKQELTKQLAHRWRTMDTDNKQIYINKYEDSKQKYNQEMKTYKKEEKPSSF